jgi:signal transduction histidine kinase
VSRLTAGAVAAGWQTWPRPGRIGTIAVLAGLYYGSARFGYTLEFSGPVGAIVWLPAGVGIAFLTIGGLGLWPGVLIGDLLANDYSALPIGSALVQTVGNILEVVLAAWLIRRHFRRDNPLGSVTDVLRIFLALAAGTALSATVGVTSAVVGGVTPFADTPAVWRTWWLGDLVGALIVVPLALAWSRPLKAVSWRPRVLEGLALLVAVVVLGEIALHSSDPLTYLLFPVLVWAALRFGQRGATLTIAIVAALTVWNTTRYLGPFVYDSITRSVLTTQLFIAVAAVSTLVLQAVVSEREDLAEEIESSRTRLVETSDRERRRLERNLHDGAQQRLVALAARLHGAAEEVEVAPGRISELLVDAENEVLAANDELRDLASGIHPAVLTDLGLGPAIRAIVLRSNVPIEVQELPFGRLDAMVEATAYYVIAESVANAHKYARAGVVSISAPVSGDTLHVEVADDGVGGAAERNGAGLQGLRDRVEAVGGTFRVVSPAGAGTSITAALPL